MTKVFLTLSLVFVSFMAQAQYSAERIAIGTLKRGFVVQNEMPSGIKYRFEVYNSEFDLHMDSFVSKNNRGFTDYTQRFSMTSKQIDQSFPKGFLFGKGNSADLSHDGYIYLAAQEEQVTGLTANLIFIEINKNKQIRLSFHYGAQQGYRAQGKFTADLVKKFPNPLSAKTVITTDWITVE